MARPTLSLFVPAWNEEDGLERTVSRGLKVLSRLADDYELIIVDDASTDRTAEIADALAQKHRQVRVVHHERNLTLGGALKTGLSNSTGDIVIYSNADLPFDLDELERALRLMESQEADMLCAYRFDRTSQGFKRGAFSFAYDTLIRALFDVQVKDVNFTLKVMHRRVLEAIELKSTGGFVESELVVKAIKKGFRVFQMGVDHFPRARRAPASPSMMVNTVKELASLFAETKSPGQPGRPVRLPAMVRPLKARKAVAGR